MMTAFVILSFFGGFCVGLFLGLFIGMDSGSPTKNRKTSWTR